MRSGEWSQSRSSPRAGGQAERAAKRVEPPADERVDEETISQIPLGSAKPARPAVNQEPGEPRRLVEAAEHHRREMDADQGHAEPLLGDAGPERERGGDDDGRSAGGRVGRDLPFDDPVDRLEERTHELLEDDRRALAWMPDSFVGDGFDEVEFRERVDEVEPGLLDDAAEPSGCQERHPVAPAAQLPPEADKGMDVSRASQGDEQGMGVRVGWRHRSPTGEGTTIAPGGGHRSVRPTPA